MARTTLDIDSPVLAEIRELQRQEGRPIGRIFSELLSEALARRRAPAAPPTRQWHARPMDALVDLADKEAIHAALDRQPE